MTDVWWEVKNFHFKPWGNNVTLRTIGQSELEFAPLRINKQLKPVEQFQVRIKFRQPENIYIPEGQEEIPVYLSLYDEDERAFFGDDFCLKLTK